MNGKTIAIGSVIGVFLALLVTKTFFIGFNHIPQNGMYPGLPAGSRLFVAKRAYRDASSVKRGDIVLFVREMDGQRYNYLWRVIALPGDKVEASGESLIINDKPVSRQRVRNYDAGTIFREQLGDATYEVAFATSPRFTPPDTSITVPPDHFFVMGDNRLEASDGRYFGPIPFGSIVGKKL